MNMVYVIENSSYDGGEWSTWQLKGLVFATKDNAQEYIDNRKGNGDRFEIIELRLN